VIAPVHNTIETTGKPTVRISLLPEDFAEAEVDAKCKKPSMTSQAGPREQAAKTSPSTQ
jgi:hypothetical protein